MTLKGYEFDYIPYIKPKQKQSFWQKFKEFFGFGPDKKETTTVTNLDGMIFGMPPSTHISDMMLHNSMPVATIIPCEPKFDKGTSLFSLDAGKGWTEYMKILNSVDFTMDGGTKKAIQVAYLADSFPSDTFNNEYGETIFDRMAQGVSSTVGDFSQILGITNPNDLKEMAGSIPWAGGAIKGGINTGEKAYGKLIESLEEHGHAKGASFAKEAGQAFAAAATGARIDFPMVWKNSSFNPAYSMTIRLYNPDPGNPNSTRKYIVGPIAAILSMALPKVGGKSVASYKWPLFCKVISPGIFNLNAGFISNVTIIKGGDQQSIAYNQSLAMCDVRIEFGSLYNSIIAGKGSEKYNEKRPTLGSYLEVLGGKSFQSLDQRKPLFKGDASPINLYGTTKSIPIKELSTRGSSTIGRVEESIISVANDLISKSKSFIG